MSVALEASKKSLIYLSGSYDYDGKVIVVLENKTALLEMDQVHRFETYI